jgi:2-phosphosulfolactate phosphatase
LPQARPTLEVLFSPADFLALSQRDLSNTVCVVFDVLRATSTMMTALGNGARQIVPVAEISEALPYRKDPFVLLAGEREGLRIRADQTGGVDFDLGNSPREFTPDAVRGKTIVITTTNGTRALRACAGARKILIGTFLGLDTVSAWIHQTRPTNLLIVCAGTFDQASYEDTLAAGALSEAAWTLYESGLVADSAVISRQIYQGAAGDLLDSMRFARNGRRLLANPALREDVAFCLQRGTLQFLASMDPEGVVRKMEIPSL